MVEAVTVIHQNSREAFDHKFVSSMVEHIEGAEGHNSRARLEHLMSDALGSFVGGLPAWHPIASVVYGCGLQSWDARIYTFQNGIMVFPCIDDNLGRSIAGDAQEVSRAVQSGESTIRGHNFVLQALERAAMRASDSMVTFRVEEVQFSLLRSGTRSIVAYCDYYASDDMRLRNHRRYKSSFMFGDLFAIETASDFIAKSCAGSDGIAWMHRMARYVDGSQDINPTYAPDAEGELHGGWYDECDATCNVLGVCDWAKSPVMSDEAAEVVVKIWRLAKAEYIRQQPRAPVVALPKPKPTPKP